MKHLEGVGGVVGVVDTYEDARSVHLIMPLCAGGDLFDRVQKEVPYTERKAATILSGVLTSLARMHQMGVTHRDIKPENFLCTGDGGLSFADFGLSAFFKQGMWFSEHLGSPNYMAPEVCGMKGESGELVTRYSEKADVWSVGVILYILLSGLPPFWGDQKQVYRQIRYEPVDYATEPWPSVSDGAKRLVQRMLERNVRRRPSAEELLADPWLNGHAPDAELSHVVADRLGRFARHNRLVKHAMHALCDTLELDEIAGMKNLFEDLDKDGSNTITMEELRGALEKPEYALTKEKLRALMEGADLDGDRTIDWKEFLAATLDRSKMRRADRLAYVFRLYDANGDGHLDRDEVLVAIRGTGGPRDADLDAIFAEMDADGDGRISYAEFAKKFSEA